MCRRLRLVKVSLYSWSLKRPSGAHGEDFNLCWQSDSLLPLMSSQSSRTEPELWVQRLILLRVEKNLLLDAPPETCVMKFFCQMDGLQTCIWIACWIYVCMANSPQILEALFLKHHCLARGHMTTETYILHFNMKLFWTSTCNAQTK